MSDQYNTVVIGGGQSGLSVSYYLKQRSRDHLVFEKATKPGNAWRNDRWDSFTLNTPNWTFRLPGAEYDGPDPNGFMPRDEIVTCFEQYIDRFALPVHFGMNVLGVEHAHQGYLVSTVHGSYLAEHVVIATGLFQQPKIPAYSADLHGSILQIHSGQYRNPAGLPPGAVLVVGSGQSGCQIAEELYQTGRKVYLSVGSAGRAPRRYRGRDIFEWLNLSGFLDRSPDKLPSPQARFAGNPQLSGNNGGHDLNLHQFYRDGVVLLGRLQGIENGFLSLAPDLKENLTKADKLESEIVNLVDGYIAEHGIDAPEDHLLSIQDGFAAEEIQTLGMDEANITTIIWAAGYRFDFSLVKLPIFDEAGYPQTERGIAHYPGLYFVGLPWLISQKTGLLLGVGEHAAYIAEHIAEHVCSQISH